MSDLFSSYESDFQLAIQEAKSKLGQIPTVSGSKFLFFYVYTD